MVDRGLVDPVRGRAPAHVAGDARDQQPGRAVGGGAQQPAGVEVAAQQRHDDDDQQREAALRSAEAE